MTSMSFNPVFYILKSANFLPAADPETWLGRIVSHYSAPHYASVPDDARSLNQRPLKELTLTDVQQVVKASKGTAYEPQLQGVLEACARKTDEATFDVTTAQIRILQLQNHSDVFARFLQLCASDPSINRNIRDWARPFGEPLFMIVGVMIWTDAKFTTGKTSDHETSMKLSAPLNMVANAVTTAQLGTPVIPTGIGDVSFGVKKGNTQEVTTTATQAGNHIFAIEYRVIRRLRHTGFTRFGMASELPRFPGQMTMADRENLTEDQDVNKKTEESDILTLEADDVPWTESLEDATDAEPVEVEKLSGCNIAISFASSA